MKKILLVAMLLVGAVVSKAQFEQGTKYVGASVSNLGLSYSTCEKLRFGFDATAGYFLYDGVMLKATAGYNHKPHFDDRTACFWELVWSIATRQATITIYAFR